MVTSHVGRCAIFALMSLISLPVCAGDSIPSHPLVGKIWSPSVGGAVEQAQFDAELRQADIALIGEVHDNPAHHRIQSEALRSATLASRRPAAVFEHIREDQQPALDEFRRFNAQARRLGTAGDLFRFLDWETSGWPAKAIFEPLFSSAIAASLPIVAGDGARATVKQVAKEGETALSEAERQRLGLDKPLPAGAGEALLDDLEKSHCGLMPKAAFGNLAYAQRYRDAHLADAVLDAVQESGTALLFAGNGHVRKDRGVPYYLYQRAPGKSVVAVLLLEVEADKTDPEAYVERGPEGQPTADFIVFTPRAERPDPCEEMRKTFAKPAR